MDILEGSVLLALAVLWAIGIVTFFVKACINFSKRKWRTFALYSFLTLCYAILAEWMVFAAVLASCQLVHLGCPALE